MSEKLKLDLSEREDESVLLDDVSPALLKAKPVAKKDGMKGAPDGRTPRKATQNDR